MPNKKLFWLKGFTLIQCLITIAIISLLSIMAQPSYSNLTEKNLMITTAKNLQLALQTARMLAITRRATITVSANHRSSNWANGFVIKHGKKSLQTYQPAQNLQISWHGFADRQKSIAILANGMTHNNGHFSIYVKTQPAIVYQLSVSKTLRSKITSNHAGVF